MTKTKEELKEYNHKYYLENKGKIKERLAKRRDKINEYSRKYYSQKKQRFADLEKENAELKEKVNILDNCDRLGDVITEAYKEQLTKAKELIKEMLNVLPKENIEGFYEITEEAEQFLKEIEK